MTDDAAAAPTLILARLSIERESLVGALFIGLGAVGLAIAVIGLAFSPSLSLPVLVGVGAGAVLLVHGILRRSAAARAAAALDRLGSAPASASR
ncbi:hypothetical protein CBF90_11970 [Microbacterium sp. AISO3]|uniref:Uncharacterized protein n=1 Tax=Microbacterium arborescens TaxID=33883 RepID=A0ABX2WH15_9MICO|nr:MULTISPECIES: hypothetical protein [Microbacterium]OAZ40015.1 hypothetical protein A9Z40_04780 [Microbacterium arborescens]OWP21524.1 hypothetical protein CBF90_11970 [Microbacterium sp. AISO3]